MKSNAVQAIRDRDLADAAARIAAAPAQWGTVILPDGRVDEPRDFPLLPANVPPILNELFHQDPTGVTPVEWDQVFTKYGPAMYALEDPIDLIGFRWVGPARTTFDVELWENQSTGNIFTLLASWTIDQDCPAGRATDVLLPVPYRLQPHLPTNFGKNYRFVVSGPVNVYSTAGTFQTDRRWVTTGVQSKDFFGWGAHGGDRAVSSAIPLVRRLPSAVAYPSPNATRNAFLLATIPLLTAVAATPLPRFTTSPTVTVTLGGVPTVMTDGRTFFANPPANTTVLTLPSVSRGTITVLLQRNANSKGSMPAHDANWNQNVTLNAGTVASTNVGLQGTGWFRWMITVVDGAQQNTMFTNRFYRDDS